MRPDLALDTYRCTGCGFFASSLPVGINRTETLDEAARVRALKHLRGENFTRILDRCEGLLPSSGAILDVGCAHGWFLDAAAARGFRVTGIEPDESMAAVAAAEGHEVVVGYFPDCLASEARYDAIFFNDVLEHMPRPDDVVGAARECLERGGLLVINLPVSDGAIFRLARLAARLGLRRPLERLWQKGLPSPHLSYFSEETLERLVSRHGLSLVNRGRLKAIAVEGAYDRIRFDRSMGPWAARTLLAAALILKGVERFLAADVRFFVFQLPGAR